MKIIDYSGIPIDLTIDSTLYTIDTTQLTIDSTYYLTDDVYNITIVPRFFCENLSVYTRNVSDEQTISTYGVEHKGNLIVCLNGLDFIEDVRYEVIITDNESSKIVWRGQVLYTLKDVQNYKLNNSDENYLNF